MHKDVSETGNKERNIETNTNTRTKTQKTREISKRGIEGSGDEQLQTSEQQATHINTNRVRK